MNFNIDEAIAKDDNLNQGISEYKIIEQKANDVAEEISSTLVESIVKNNDKFNLSMAILAVAKCFGHLASYMYDTEEEFLTDVRKSREAVVSDIIPALLNPQPCEECKNGNPQECLNPNVRGDYTTSRFIPLLCNMLIEYDLFNKVVYMYTAGKENDVAAGKENDVAVKTNKEEK